MTSICNACHEEISGRVVTALSKKWHPQHFACTECKLPITAEFNEKDGKVYCSDDYSRLFNQSCKACGQLIKGRVIEAMGVHWHPEHWVCAACKGPLANSHYEKEGKPFCKPCHTKLHVPRCHACRKPVEDSVIVAFGEKWHQDCFKCGKCNKPVTEASFQVSNEKPLCSKCAK